MEFGVASLIHQYISLESWIKLKYAEHFYFEIQQLKGYFNNT